jgi:hypothetical protein
MGFSKGKGQAADAQAGPTEREVVVQKRETWRAPDGSVRAVRRPTPTIRQNSLRDNPVYYARNMRYFS